MTKKRTPEKFIRRTSIQVTTKGKGGIDFILSDATPDRYDDIIMTSGWELDNFNKNPIALFAHSGSFPIGTWKDVRVEENALRGTLVLADEGTSDRIDEIRSLVDAGILKAVSVGFTPIDYEERQGDTYGLVYTKQELVECSLVSVPANPNALQVAKELQISKATRELVFDKQVNKKAKETKVISSTNLTLVEQDQIFQKQIDEINDWLIDHGKINDAETNAKRKERDSLEHKQKNLWV